MSEKKQGMYLVKYFLYKVFVNMKSFQPCIGLKNKNKKINYNTSKNSIHNKKKPIKALRDLCGSLNQFRNTYKNKISGSLFDKIKMC